ncbi:hypothetical protein LTR62_000493 [Meristemomyces frigidus]|uniref:Uncharacterized protein n=1 Tax=Meristemomyces frigidus TaxID=1508187 RepID=A0AAN7YC97_9PEZI|nr:hypothetical protein LTR62_000493 [Meristemomyces frigidus]
MRAPDMNRSEAQMDELMAKKRELEDAEEYNQPALRSKQSQAVAKEVAKRSLGRSVSREVDADEGFGFALPSSGSPDNELPIRANGPMEEPVDFVPTVTVEDIEAKVKQDEKWDKKSARAKKHSRAAQRTRMRKMGQQLEAQTCLRPADTVAV